jgi:hypothetical protein
MAISTNVDRVIPTDIHTHHFTSEIPMLYQFHRTIFNRVLLPEIMAVLITPHEYDVLIKDIESNRILKLNDGNENSILNGLQSLCRKHINRAIGLLDLEGLSLKELMK